jgi:hypothetical protein
MGTNLFIQMIVSEWYLLIVVYWELKSAPLPTEFRQVNNNLPSINQYYCKTSFLELYYIKIIHNLIFLSVDSEFNQCQS